MASVEAMDKGKKVLQCHLSKWKQKKRENLFDEDPLIKLLCSPLNMDLRIFGDREGDSEASKETKELLKAARRKYYIWITDSETPMTKTPWGS